jgi:hypothetical protein
LGTSLCAAVACSSAAQPTTEKEANISGAGCAGDLDVLFPVAYSAFDGVHKFKVPATVAGVKGLNWSANPAEAVDIQPNTSGSEVLITTKRDGVVTITASNGKGSCGTAKLTIAKVDAELYDIGQARYANGVVYSRGRGDGGAREAGTGGSDAGAASLAACTNCHATGGSDYEHTPTQTAGYSDADLVNIFTKAQKPPGVPQRVMTLERWQRIHMWTMTEDEKAGLIVYLRALEPKAQGAVDWGGRGRDGGAPSADAGPTGDAGQ